MYPVLTESRFFYFFHCLYSLLWALACQTLPLHFSLSPNLSIISVPSHHLRISFYFFSLSFPGSSPLSRPLQFLSENLSEHPILLHSLQVTQPTYPLPFYPFYFIIFLSKISRACSSFFVIIHVSAPYVAVGLINVLIHNRSRNVACQYTTSL